jgi:hypothetical protein
MTTSSRLIYAMLLLALVTYMQGREIHKLNTKLMQIEGK